MKILPYVLLFLSFSLTAQTKYLTKTGVIEFEASVPSFEEVKAKSNSVTAIINTDNGEFAALALVKGFRFKNALMEEHFNENYAESHDYPKAKFKGKLANFSMESLSADGSNFTMTGVLEFHGQTKSLDGLEVNVALRDGRIVVSGSFIAYPADYGIKIPKIVRNKIADEVQVSFTFEMDKK